MSMMGMLWVNAPPPCKHKLVVTHTKEGVDITCKHCNFFTISTRRGDVARIAGIFQKWKLNSQMKMRLNI